MFKYLLQAYNDPGVGPIEQINIRVIANSESEAIEKAKKHIVRQFYAVIEVEILDDGAGRDIKKA